MGMIAFVVIFVMLAEVTKTGASVEAIVFRLSLDYLTNQG
jgi:hypothetical protein